MLRRRDLPPPHHQIYSPAPAYGGDAPLLLIEAGSQIFAPQTRADGDGRVELLKLVHASATQLGPERADQVLRMKARTTTGTRCAQFVEAAQTLKSLD